MPITIRDADEADVEMLADLNRAVQDLHVATLPRYFKSYERGAIVDLFRSRLRRADVRAWIAAVESVPVGYAVGVVRERPGDALCFARRFYELEEIAVSADHRRQGVMRALIEHVVTHARGAGIADVELTSWSFNVEAHAAFAALGFRPMSVRFGRGSG